MTIFRCEPSFAERAGMGSKGGDAVHLYEVYNTSHRSLLVLAKDREAALSLAWSAGHIRHVDSGLTSDGRDAYEVRAPWGRLEDYWTGLQAAISQRLQGVVELADERVFVGNTEITR